MDRATCGARGQTGEPTREPGISSVSDIAGHCSRGYFYSDGTWPRPSGLRADSGMRSAEQWRVLVTSPPLPVGLGSLTQELLKPSASLWMLDATYVLQDEMKFLHWRVTTSLGQIIYSLTWLFSL